MSNQSIILSCPICGNRLQIGQKINRFACTNCDNELIVHRETGIIYLEPLTNNQGNAPVAQREILANMKKKGWFARLPAPIRLIVICLGIIFFLAIVLPKSTPGQSESAAASATQTEMSPKDIGSTALATYANQTVTAPTLTPAKVAISKAINTSLPTSTPLPTATSTDTPLPTSTPLPTDTSTPLPPAPPFMEIRKTIEGMTSAQWDQYSDSLKEFSITNWKGWVENVDSHLFGGYELQVDMDSPQEPLSVQDVTFDIPDDLALKLKKDSPVVFSGKIKSVHYIFGSLQITLDDASVAGQ